MGVERDGPVPNLIGGTRNRPDRLCGPNPNHYGNVWDRVSGVAIISHDQESDIGAHNICDRGNVSIDAGCGRWWDGAQTGDLACDRAPKVRDADTIICRSS